MKRNEQSLYPLDEFIFKGTKYRVITVRFSDGCTGDIIYLSEKVIDKEADADEDADDDIMSNIIDPYDETRLTEIGQEELESTDYTITKDSDFVLDYLKKLHCAARCISKDCAACVIPGKREKALRFLPTLGDLVYTEKAGNTYKLIQETLEDLLYQNIDSEEDKVWFTNQNVPTDTPHKSESDLPDCLGTAGRVKKYMCGTCLSECAVCPFAEE
jgi:hypothetical protein